MASHNSFDTTLSAYKHAIDDDIAAYAAYVRTVTAQQFGRYAELEVNTFLDVLSRGGKRIRGALVMAGYEMMGGRNRPMIIQTARAIEMLHAYLLICDDIQDRSVLRRGKPSAHEVLAAYHRAHGLRGDPGHAGISLALNAALAGAHAAQVVLANMDADPQLKLNVLSITNRTLGITEHGQTYDIMNELVEHPAKADIDRVLEWKTAQYSFINPLHVGMVLAGANCEATDAITPYGRHVGRAFQIVDDCVGIFGDERELGKQPIDDIREGKRTLLMQYALEHALAADRIFLEKSLGNSRITATEFERCKQIIEASGARRYVQRLTIREVDLAIESLKAGERLWSAQGTTFLTQLASALRDRSR